MKPNRPDIATLHKIGIEVQRLRGLAIKDGLESVASLFEGTLSEAREPKIGKRGPYKKLT